MKILYAVQKTGNGHLARAEAIIPILKKYAEVDVLASGRQSDILLNHHVTYDLAGISLFYSDTGGLSLKKIIAKNNLARFFQDVRKIPVRDYDLIINDFEPVSAWAAMLCGARLVALSHQASLLFPNVPKQKNGNFLLSLVLKWYAPAKRRYGFHFRAYNPKIYTPVIRGKIRALSPYISDKVVVYLPSFSNDILYEILKELPTKFKIFSKEIDGNYRRGNCSFFKINEDIFFQHLESCMGVICNAGFELPAEALFLKKKLFVLPIRLQPEQRCNAAALAEIGARTAAVLTKKDLEEWLSSDQDIHVDWPDMTEEIIRTILKENLQHQCRNMAELSHDAVVGCLSGDFL